MFKKLLTTMLVLAVVATAGTAMAGDVEWKFYGKVHSSINMMNNGENSQLGLSSNTSRFGFKGWAPMTDDMSFVWQFERGLNIADGGAGEMSVRNSYIGFKGEKFGEVRMGRHDTPHKTLGRKTTFFFDTVGDNRTVTFGTDTRESDILAWVSPDWSGFNLFLAYGFDRDGTKLNPDAAADAEFYSETIFSGMATYAKDEFFFGASWIMFSEAWADWYIDEDGARVFGDAPMVLRFAGKYSAEKFAVAASYLNIGGQMWDGADFVDMTANTIGGEVLFHANEKYDVKFGYYMANPYTDAEDIEGTDLDESEVSFNLMTIGVDRKFGKNLQMYVQYAMLSNGDNSDAVLGGMSNDGLSAGTNGFGNRISGWIDEDGLAQNPSGLSWGMAYKW